MSGVTQSINPLTIFKLIHLLFLNCNPFANFKSHKIPVKSQWNPCDIPIFPPWLTAVQTPPLVPLGPPMDFQNTGEKPGHYESLTPQRHGQVWKEDGHIKLKKLTWAFHKWRIPPQTSGCFGGTPMDWKPPNVEIYHDTFIYFHI